MGAFFETAGGIFLVRLLVALACGATIGVERTRRDKDAGIRTHAIIAVASALLMIISKYGFCDLTVGLEVGGTDNSMVAHQMVNGISFLCAGVICFSKGDAITGLTSACYIWCGSAIGMACGCGMMAEAAFTTIFLISVQNFVHWMKIGESAYHYQTVEITYLPTPDVTELLKHKQKRYGIYIRHTEILRNDDGTMTLRLRVRMKKSISFDHAFRLMDQNNLIKTISS